MNINWQVRIKNKAWWVAVVSTAILLIQAIAALFGWSIDLGDIQGKFIVVIDAVFAFLVALGIVVDPTTKGIGDSGRALSYTEPHDDAVGFGEVRR